MTNGTWRKSSYSSGGATNCVEVGHAGAVLVRDTKQAHLGDRRTVITFTPEAWQAFTKTLR